MNTDSTVPILYGIKACSTMKKAQEWLEQHGITYSFHDYKRLGIDQQTLAAWCHEHGWEKILNRAGTTFRQLDEHSKADLNEERAIQLMLAQPSMIKRPVLKLAQRTLVGFQPDRYTAELQTV